MKAIELLFVSIYGVSSIIVFLKTFHECYNKDNAFGEKKFLTLYGAFVWADAVVFGLFWGLVSLIALILKDFLLFLFVVSLFWVVRSIGEAIYWFNQQFSTINRNPPEKFFIYKIFKNDSVWFVLQIGWQCATVIFLVLAIYFGSKWISTKL